MEEEIKNSKVTYENFFLFSKGIWEPLETHSVTEKAPDFVSYKDEEPTSFYWYGTDEIGDFIIRKSQHWKVVSRCRWDIVEKNFCLVSFPERGWTSWAISFKTGEITWVLGKIYLHNMEMR